MEKLIFTHIPKTAGTSIKEALLNDNNFSLLDSQKHESIHNIKKNNIKAYNKYRKFTVVRNPYDKMISTYFFLQKNNINKHMDVRQFNEWIKDPYKLPCIQKLPIQTKYLLIVPQYLWIDETVTVLKYENLNNELNKFLNQKIVLPKINNSKHEHYLKYYNNKSLTIIRERYKEDFNKFNYEKL
tara:strand:- start:38 stop:589 length:552 start_codon:yes stop_codon:yes gene_type:complete